MGLMPTTLDARMESAWHAGQTRRQHRGQTQLGIAQNLGQGGMECMITHPSVLRVRCWNMCFDEARAGGPGRCALQGCD